MDLSKRIEVVFFRSASGDEPVREWLKDLSKADRRAIGEDIALVEYGWPVGMPTCRPMGAGLYEVRTNLKDRIARVLFLIRDGNMVLLHGFIKKTNSTPKGDKELALGRKHQWEKNQ